MKWLRAIFAELFGLFVDDGAFAVAILLWLIVIGVVVRMMPAGAWQAIVLFAGLACILVESALRRSRRR